MKSFFPKILIAAIGITVVTAPLAASADTLGVQFFDHNGNVAVRAGFYDNYGGYHVNRDDRYRDFRRDQAIRRDERFDQWQAQQRFERERDQQRFDRDRFDRDHRDRDDHRDHRDRDDHRDFDRH